MNKKELVGLIGAIIYLIVSVSIILFLATTGIKVVQLLWLADMKMESIVTGVVFFSALLGDGKRD